MKTVNTIENCSIVLGTALGLTQIETIMGITVLAFQLILILVKIILKVIDHIKQKDLQAAVQDIEQGQQEIESLHKKQKGGE